jgi:hypothetical protein
MNGKMIRCDVWREDIADRRGCPERKWEPWTGRRAGLARFFLPTTLVRHHEKVAQIGQFFESVRAISRRPKRSPAERLMSADRLWRTGLKGLRQHPLRLITGTRSKA